jgi:exosortase/archaeosortase family protein
LLAHAAAFFLLFIVTRAVFGNPAAPPGPGIFWLAGWVILAVLSSTSALIGVLGGARWFIVLRRDLLAVGPRGVLVWFAGLATATAWTSFPELTLTPVVAALQSLSVHAIGTPHSFLLRVDRWTMVISPGCSGYEGFGVAASLITLYLLRFRRHFRYPRALWAIPAGLFAVWLANAARFMVLGLVGSRFGASVAVASFHSKASWMLAAGVALLVVRALRDYSRPHDLPLDSRSE